MRFVRRFEVEKITRNAEIFIEEAEGVSIDQLADDTTMRVIIDTTVIKDQHDIELRRGKAIGQIYTLTSGGKIA